FTASADKPTHERILAAGADRVLTKPISETDLVRAVRRALRRGRSVGSIQQNFRSDQAIQPLL
ncbi:MAG: DNA-binding response regulator, partial [Candidatus Competibacteraceae bacterium]|nr:DNA-binding response regulator [Candidatus Competibacteraceae bacterium]